MKALFEEYSGPIIGVIVAVCLIGIVNLLMSSGFVGNAINKLLSDTIGQGDTNKVLGPIQGSSDKVQYQLEENGDETYTLVITKLK